MYRGGLALGDPRPDRDHDSDMRFATTCARKPRPAPDGRSNTPVLFHTFGQGLEAEALRHGNDGGHNGEIVAIGQHVPHERDVDLQFMNGKSLEVSQ